jgi:hypothetical protein
MGGRSIQCVMIALKEINCSGIASYSHIDEREFREMAAALIRSGAASPSMMISGHRALALFSRSIS